MASASLSFCSGPLGVSFTISYDDVTLVISSFIVNNPNGVTVTFTVVDPTNVLHSVGPFSTIGTQVFPAPPGLSFSLINGIVGDLGLSSGWSTIILFSKNLALPS